MDRAELRAGDEDRKRMVDELQRHYVDGRLTEDEYDERVGRALAARTFGELDPLLRDLPAAPLAAAEPTPVEPTERHGLLDRPDFRVHFYSYALVMALLVAIWLITTPGRYFWPIWPMLGGGIALAAHALFGPNRTVGHAERRQGRRERCEQRRGRH